METIYNTLISVDDSHTLWNNQKTVFLDCTYYLLDLNRGRQEYLQGHIPGAYFLDIAHDLSAPLTGDNGRHPLPNPITMLSTFRSCAINNDSQVICYDQLNGVYASRAWWLLNWLGHTKTAVLNGGFEHWKNAGFETDNAWTPPKKGNLLGIVRSELVSLKEEIATTPLSLIDSREYKRFIGEIEPIDPVAGHIKGAICIPYLDNVYENGLWKPVEFLQKKFELINQNPPPVFYCGSGVTACHNILAYKIATGHDARLYGGSWSEWIHFYPAVVGK